MIVFGLQVAAQELPSDGDEQGADIESAVSQFDLVQPDDEFGKMLVRGAARMGAEVDRTFFLSSELDQGPAIGRDFNKITDMQEESGYMRNGMQDHMKGSLIANPELAKLFRDHALMRQGGGMELTSAFAPLVSFVEGYIKENDKANSEQSNGISHHALAVQVIRASFCFGNDPFMILAKMRRETNFTRKLVSPTGAVGWSQMTGIAVKEVQHQMSGDSNLALPEAKAAFQQGIRCFTGLQNFNVPQGPSETVKSKLKEKWGLDIVFGQIMVKTLVSYVKAGSAYGNNAGGIVAAYEDAFVAYNGDSNSTAGICTKKKSVQMRFEYACDVISQYKMLSAQWNRFLIQSTGKGISINTWPRRKIGRI